jgi:hypothetical protein
MSKDTFYFPHDYNARNDHKVQVLLMDHGAAAYGIYWALVEILHEEESHSIDMNSQVFFKSFSKQLATTTEQVMKIIEQGIDVELFYKDGNELMSERVNRNIQHRAEISLSKSKAGKASAEKRKRLADVSTNVEHVSTAVQQNPTKKEKERKENKEEDINKGRIQEKSTSELRTSQQMFDAGCMKNKIDLQKCKELLEIFITDQKGCDGLYRPIGEIKQHFLNWIPKHIQVNKREPGVAEHLTQNKSFYE